MLQGSLSDIKNTAEGQSLRVIDYYGAISEDSYRLWQRARSI